MDAPLNSEAFLPLEVVINPTQLTEVEEYRLFEFFFDFFKNTSTFIAGTPYSFKAAHPEDPLLTRDCTLTLTHDIFRRHDQSGWERLFVLSPRNICVEKNLPFYTNARLIAGVLRESKSHEKALCFKNSANEDVLIEAIIDPLTMSEEQLNFFGGMLNSITEQLGKDFFPQGEQYFKLRSDTSAAQLILNLFFVKSMVCNKKKSAGYAYEIIGDQIGAGSYGKVYGSLGTLTSSISGRFLVKPASHVIKEVYHDEKRRNKKENVFTEFAMARRIHLRSKKPVIISTQEAHKNISFRVEDFQKGVTLAALMQEDRTCNGFVFSTEKRLELSIALLFALKEQVHAGGVIHRDINPGNIKVHMVGPDNTIIVKFLDPGFAKDSQTECYEGVGSPLYRSLESFENRPTNELSDLYGMAILIAELWGENYPASYTHDAIYEFSKSPQFVTLYHLGNINLDAETKNKFKQVIESMSHPDQGGRCSVGDAIRAVSYIRTMYLSSSFPSDSPSVEGLWQQAHFEGLDLREELNQLAKSHQDKMITEGNVKEMLNRVMESLVKIDDQPFYVKEFTFTLGTEFFAGLSTHQQISTKMMRMMDQYVNILAELDKADGLARQYKGDVSITGLSEAAYDLECMVDHLMGKCYQEHLTLDGVTRLIERLERRFAVDIMPLINKVNGIIDAEMSNAISLLSLADASRAPG